MVQSKCLVNTILIAWYSTVRCISCLKILFRKFMPKVQVLIVVLVTWQSSEHTLAFTCFCASERSRKKFWWWIQRYRRRRRWQVGCFYFIYIYMHNNITTFSFCYTENNFLVCSRALLYLSQLTDHRSRRENPADSVSTRASALSSQTLFKQAAISLSCCIALYNFWIICVHIIYIYIY